MVSLTGAKRQPLASDAQARRHMPGEGWLIVLLHLALVLVATWTVQSVGWSDHARLLPAVAAGATLFGLILAKSPAIDLLAHLLAFWIGVLVVWVVSAESVTGVSGGRRARLLDVAERARTWIQGSAQGEPANDRDLFLGLLVMSVWLVAYMSAWTLYRRHWIGAAVGLPAIVVLSNAGYSEGISPWVLAGTLVASVILTASHFHYRRRTAWRDDEAMWTSSTQWRVAAFAVQIGLAAVIAAWIAPDGAREQTLNRVQDRLAKPLTQIEDWGGGVFSQFGGSPATRGASYSQFSDSFTLGGALDLGDDPAVVLDADAASYLVAYRYDHWDGSGWDSAVERTFSGRNADGKRYSPQMRFAPNQPVALSEEVTTERAPLTGRVTLIGSSGRVLMTLDTFQEAEVPTTVQLSWRTLDDARLPIDDLDTLPPDLRHLAMLLAEANEIGFPAQSTTPLPGDQDLDQALLAEQKQLQDRLIRVDWRTNQTGRVDSLRVSGQLPVYDDVEAVFGKDDPAGTTYSVTGLASRATPDELRAAGQAYPTFVEDRYLQQSLTTTARTRDLAAAIVEQAGASTPFDQALAIQDDLRQRIQYNEGIATPPDDRDLVDYVLFDSREGYCEYYASAMAVMLRTLGIPSRIAVGYYPAAYDPQYGGYLYRDRNAHAWVEAFFPSYGWIPFEPTASQPVRDYGGNAFPNERVEPSPTPLVDSTPTPDVVPTGTLEAIPAAATTDTGADEAGDGLTFWVIRVSIALLGVLLGTVVIMSFFWRRGLGGLAATDAVWARVLKAGRWIGIRAEPSMTPLEYADAIGRAVPSARGAVSSAATNYMVRRYGGAVVTSGSTESESRLWRELRQPLSWAWARRRLLRRK